MWKDATIQVIFSLGLGIGALPNLARYNDFRNNCLRDTFLIIIGDTLTSFLSGLVVFSFLGYIADQRDIAVNHLICEGPLLTFVTLIQGITLFAENKFLKHFMSFLFALLLLTLGLDCIFAHFDTIQSAFLDNFVSLRKKRGKCETFDIPNLNILSNSKFYIFSVCDNGIKCCLLPDQFAILCIWRNLPIPSHG